MRRDSSATRLMAPIVIGGVVLSDSCLGQVHKLISIRIEGRRRLKVRLNLKVDGVRENKAVPHR